MAWTTRRRPQCRRRRHRVDRRRVELGRSAADRRGHRLVRERQQPHVLAVPVALDLSHAHTEAAPLRRRARVSLQLGAAHLVGLRHHLLDEALVRRLLDARGVLLAVLGGRRAPRREEAGRERRQLLERLPTVVKECIDLNEAADGVPLLVRLPAAEHVDHVACRDGTVVARQQAGSREGPWRLLCSTHERLHRLELAESYWRRWLVREHES